ncbi:MAG: NAD(P)/FAD-dependent oxidoreductase [Desulfobacteraceae bacterium]|nr:NAD(P)/FAD-dependent oxidoreductase [Desulfobacteraceae bacterium]
MGPQEFGAILQRDKTTYAIVPRTPVGLVTPEILERIAGVVRKHGIPIVKITSGQRLVLVGIKEEEIEPVWKELQLDIGRALELCLHYVQACPGTSVCRYGVQDSLGLGQELENLFYDFALPAKLKIGISGCPMTCAESQVRDIGLVGKKNGWSLYFGGNAGGRPRIGDLLAEDLGREEAIALLRRCLAYYKENAKPRERTARFVERTGIEGLRAALAG